MKKLLSTFLTLLSACAPAYAAEKPIDAQNRVYQNYLVNPGFENGSYGWTASGGATKTADMTSKGEGNYGYDWDSNSASQTLLQSVTIPTGLYGRNGVAYCIFKAASGTATHTLTVDDGSTNLVTPVTIASSTSIFQRTAVNFIYPSSGSVRIKMTSVASNEPALYIDSCFLGEANNLNFVSQAQFIGSAYIDTTASCSPAVTNTALTAFSTISNCPGPTIETNPGPGTIQTTDANGIIFTVNNLPPGEFEVSMNGYYDASASSVDCVGISDGTTTGPASCARPNTSTGSPFFVTNHFTYSTAGNRTFTLFGSGSSGTNTINNATSLAKTSFRIVKFPSSTEQSFRADQAPASWSGYHDNTCVWARTNSAYGDPTADASCALVERQNRNFGTVSAAGSVLPEISLTFPKSGRYWICAYPKMDGQTGNAFIDARLWDGTTVISEGEFKAVDSGTRMMPLCGIYNATAGAAIISIQTKASSGIVNIQTNSTNTSSLEWSISDLDSPAAAPVLVGSVMSSSSGSEHIERATIANSGTCTITTQSDSWVSSLSHPATGRCVLNFAAGEWSVAPSCTTSGDNTTTSGIRTVAATITATTSSIEIGTYNSGAALADGPFNIICMGAR